MILLSVLILQTTSALVALGFMIGPTHWAAVIDNNPSCSMLNKTEMKDKYDKYLQEDPRDYSSEFIWRYLNRRNKRHSRRHRYLSSSNLVHRIYGNGNCPSELNRTSQDWMGRSLCPWYVVLTYNANRYPDTLAEARCSCKYCYNFNGTKQGKKNKIHKPRCKEIKMKHKVLKYDENNEKFVCNKMTKKYEVIETFEQIPIGCACATSKKDRYVSNPPNIKS